MIIQLKRGFSTNSPAKPAKRASFHPLMFYNQPMVKAKQAVDDTFCCVYFAEYSITQLCCPSERKTCKASISDTWCAVAKKKCVKLADVMTRWRITNLKKALNKSSNKCRPRFNVHENFSEAINSREAQATHLTFSSERNLWESFARTQIHKLDYKTLFRCLNIFTARRLSTSKTISHLRFHSTCKSNQKKIIWNFVVN